jgi:hypothetical protein
VRGSNVFSVVGRNISLGIVTGTVWAVRGSNICSVVRSNISVVIVTATG